jgi:glucuronoarabinoxylan endo-1,4-beta-xylanase
MLVFAGRGTLDTLFQAWHSNPRVTPLMVGGRFLLLAGLLGCSEADDAWRVGNPAPVTAAEEVASVEANVTRQPISGFGASSAWTAPNLSDELSDQLFSIESGVGLSLLRVRIAPDGTTSELATARKAVERGASVWAAPWSPPGEWKDNGSDIEGGSLLLEHYQDWADRLADFVAATEASGVPLLALSAQNEPNHTAEWETCLWSPDELVSFVRDYLGPALRTRELATPILAPETKDWDTVQTYAQALLADGQASEFVNAIATHAYGGNPFAFTSPAEAGKEFWVTELDDENSNTPIPFDAGMDSALKVAKLIHNHLTVAAANAWHYWWISPAGAPSNEALTDRSALTRRAHVMGNWSKFVRPGFVRVEANPNPSTGVFVTAFRDVEATRLVIVAVNETTRTIEQRFGVGGGSIADAVPFTTSEELALVEQESLLVTDGAFTALLGGRSVTTFVSQLHDLAVEAEPEPSPTGGDPPPPRSPEELSDQTGCSCRAVGHDGPDSGSLLALLALAAARARHGVARRGARA